MTISFRTSATNRQGGTGSPQSLSLTIPSAVQEGDLLVLGYIVDSAPGDTGGQGTINDPSGVTGWTRFSSSQQTSPGSIAQAWWKIAAAADAGATVTLSYGTDLTGPRAALTLAAWGGPDNTTPLPVISAPLNSTTSSTSHVMPTIDTTGHANCLIASIFLDRESTESSSFTPSSGWTLRTSNLNTAGTTGGNPGCAVIDSGTQVATGAPGQGGGTITGNQAGSNNYGWTFAIAPAVTVQTARPTVDITTTNWTPSTSLGSGVAECTLVADNSDSTFVTSQAAPSAQVWEAKLPSMSAAPDTVTNRVYFTGGAVSGTVVTDLVQGTTVIATRTDTYASAPPTTPTDLVITLTSGQKSAISDLTDLRIRCTVTAA